MRFKKFGLVLLCLILFALRLQAQTFPFKYGGFNCGLTFNFGTTLDRIGLYADGFYFQEYVQFNTSLRFFYNFRTFGPSVKGLEFQPSFGIVGAFGERDTVENPFFTSISNQTQRKYALGYSYNFYFDQGETSQKTGTILIGVDNFELITENDILGAPKKDRFRTGAIKFSYRYGNMLFALSTTMWTGNPHSPLSKKVVGTDFPSRFGYVDFSQAPYGGFSNGIFALQFQYAWKYGQEIRFSAGADSERVRNLFQNRLIHDMYFWPKKWNKARNPHLPMLDNEGKPYLYQKGQKLKPTKPFIDVSLNPSIFY